MRPTGATDRRPCGSLSVRLAFGSSANEGSAVKALPVRFPVSMDTVESQ